MLGNSNKIELNFFKLPQKEAPWALAQNHWFLCILTAHGARKFTCRHVMHRARAPSTKMNNDRADGHCYTFGDPHLSFQKQILFTIISTLFKNEQKLNVGS